MRGSDSLHEPLPLDLALAWLYVPATRPDRFAKAAATADGVVIDLEDAVHPAERAAAREGLAPALDALAVQVGGWPVPVVVRVNSPATPDFALDVAAVAPLVRRGLVAAIRVAKVDSAADAARAADTTAGWGIARRLIVQLETARAVRDAHEIAAVDGIHSLMLGEADLRADLGLPRANAASAGLQLARATVVLAARAAGLPAPLASAYVNVADTDGLAADCAAQRELGFLGRSCIHPRQVEVVRAAFRPSDADLAWAEAVLAQIAGMDDSGSGVATLADGSFIDAPVIRQARTIAVLRDSRRRAALQNSATIERSVS